MFKEQYIRDNDKLHAKETLLMEIQRKAEKESARGERRSRFTRYGAVAAAALFILAGAVGIALSGRGSGGAEPAVMSLSAKASGLQPESVGSYDELFDLIDGLNGGGETGGGVAMDLAVENAAAEPAAAEAAAADSGSFSSAATAKACPPDFSETNVQVPGVDEADIVKTDGKYIYYIVEAKLYILEAAGENTKVLSTTELEAEDGWWGYTSEMFLSGDRLMILTQGNRNIWVRSSTDGMEQNREETRILLYDVSNRAHPLCDASLGQSGSYVTSRMAGDYVYTVTSQYFWQPLREQPVTFVPSLTVDGNTETMAASDILIPAQPRETAYTVISAIHMAEGRDFTSAKAIFGGTATVYCNGEHLYLARSCYDSETTPIAPDKTGKNAQITNSASSTKLTLLSLKEGKIEKLAAGEVPGTPINQFAMDEYKGTFRIVTSVNKWTETIYTDGVDTYDYKDENYNALYTLDDSLAIQGKIENLAKDEWVESVRFDGDVGYFVTFRQTDPLFSVDLTDPANPKILGTLKIPGFSEYLHVYGEGLLLGIGYAADEETGGTQGVKLSMFDIRDKKNVQETDMKRLDADWTAVGNNHKAILVDGEKNLIAFPADGSYYVFSYKAGEGFTQQAKIGVDGDLWSTDLRGLYIGDNLYVLGNDGVTVITLSGFNRIGKVAF